MTATSDTIMKELLTYEGEPFLVNEWATDLNITYAKVNYAMTALQQLGIVEPCPRNGYRFFRKTKNANTIIEKNLKVSTA